MSGHVFVASAVAALLLSVPSLALADDPPAPTKAPAGTATITFRAEGGEAVTLHAARESVDADGASEMAPLASVCKAPCTSELPAGTYELALSDGLGTPVGTSRVEVRGGASTIDGKYISHSGLRTAGWVVALGSLGVGAAVTLHGVLVTTRTCTAGGCSEGGNGGEILAGLAVAAIGGVIGAVMATRTDGAKIEVVSGVPAAQAPARLLGLGSGEGAALPLPLSSSLQGATLRVRF